MKTLRHVPLELLFWVAALVMLASAGSPDATSHDHFSLCPLANFGFNWCPGCGIGRSMGHLLHGHLRESMNMHWFGIPALLILIYRIITLLKQELSKRNLIGKEKYYV